MPRSARRGISRTKWGLPKAIFFQGELTMDQLLFKPSHPGLPRSIGRRCGGSTCAVSSTHPGGGVMGAPGANAARARCSRISGRRTDHGGATLRFHRPSAGGHNGLVLRSHIGARRPAACSCSRLNLESAGAARHTGICGPVFRVSSCARICLHLMPADLIRGLELESHGLEFRRAGHADHGHCVRGGPPPQT